MSKAKDAYQQIELWREESARLRLMISDVMLREVTPSIWLLQEASQNVLKKFVKKLDHDMRLELLLPKYMQWVLFDFNDVHNHHDIIVLSRKNHILGAKDETCEIDVRFFDMSVWEMCALTRQEAMVQYQKFMREQCLKAFDEVHKLQKRLEELNHFTAQYSPVFASGLLFDDDSGEMDGVDVF